MRKDPPRLAQRFFSWYCRNELHDSILGDLNERFEDHIQKYGAWKARLLYWKGVFQFMNRFTLKRAPISYNYYSTSMIKNNLISSLRFFMRNKGFAFINIFGLTLGFSSFLLILFFVNHSHSFDKFHPNHERLFRINFAFQDHAGNVTTLVNSPPALAPGIAGKFPEIEKISQMRYANNSLFTTGDVSFYEDHGYYADSLFLETIPFELSSGDPNTALDYPNSIVLSKDLALKYFNDPAPIGATLSFNNTTSLEVTGVIAEIPTNSHLNFNFLISFSTYQVPEGYASDLTSWSWLGFLTYTKLAPDADPSLLESKLVQFYKELYPDNPTPPRPIVQQLSDIYLGSAGMADDLGSHIRSGNRFSVNALLTVAILILVVAGFNFSNLTHALCINRTKSTGIRKVLGANKNSILGQLLTESLILTITCALISMGIIAMVFPVVSHFMNWEFRPGVMDYVVAGPILASVILLIGLLSGLYPAFTLANFDVIKSIKGTLKTATKNPFQLKNVLVMIQFAISIGLICATIIMSQQINYLRTQETGYNSENVVLVKMLPEDLSQHFDTFKDKMLQQAGVLSVSRSERVVGDPWPFSSIRKVNEDPSEGKRIFFNLADYDFFETMDITLKDGRFFSEDYANDATRAVIINEQAAQLLRLEDPVGSQVHFFELDGPRTIIGMVDDFSYTSLHHETGPAVVILPFIDLEHLYVKFAPGRPASQIALLEDTWQQEASGIPLDWKFLDDDLERLYQSEEKISMMIQVFSVLAILLACLGLYGIVTFMINTRVKEIGVRKVLGASISSIYTLFARKYIYQIGLAMGLILPLIHYLLTDWLNNFAFHIQISWWVYPMATLLLLLMILITITFKILKAAHVNPTNLLRIE